MTAGTTPSKPTCGLARQRCPRAGLGSSRSGRCCTARVTGWLAMSWLLTCSPGSAGAAWPADRGHGDGAAAVAGPVGPGSGGGVQLRCALEVCLRWAGVRLPQLQSYRAGGHGARLAASARPERIFAVTVEAARQAGLVGVRRVLDSTPLYDAVATMDTVTLLGAAIRGCSGRPTSRWRPSCGGCWPAPTTTPAWPSHRSTGTTRRPGRCWWTHAPGMPMRCWRSSRPLVAGGGGRGRPAVGGGGGPGPGAGSRRQLRDRRQGRRRPGDLHRRPRCPPWSQDQRPRL
jgi:hypothetical protein